MNNRHLLLKCFVACTLIVLVFSEGSSLTNEEFEEEINVTDLLSGSSYRDPRVFRLRIPADNCASAITGFDEGYCDGFASCLANFGVLSGVCPNIIIGVCCLVKRSCGGTIQTRIAYFRNRLYPAETTSSGSCSVTIKRYQTDVVQIRIDFLQFELENPTGTSPGNTCTRESLMIQGGDSRFLVPIICGKNTGQHMYVNFAAGSDITLRVTLDGSTSATQSKFNLKITQYRSNHRDKAPDGCLQYFLQTTGSVESFNYIGGQHLNNQIYDICVRRLGTPATECVTWTFTDLSISSQAATNGDECFPRAGPLLDYINIPGGIVGAIKGNAYCASTSTGTSVRARSSKITVVIGPSEPNPAAGTTLPSTETKGFKMSFSLGAGPCT